MIGITGGFWILPVAARNWLVNEFMGSNPRLCLLNKLPLDQDPYRVIIQQLNFRQSPWKLNPKPTVN